MQQVAMQSSQASTDSMRCTAANAALSRLPCSAVKGAGFSADRPGQG
ncbi:hypothetical protein SynRS9907_01075 [Synechococcus sp. RS9907]|nr:hypothetical protein SynRS9907_01075 [Synechococcus sp. RS9907]